MAPTIMAKCNEICQCIPIKVNLRVMQPNCWTRIIPRMSKELVSKSIVFPSFGIKSLGDSTIKIKRLYGKYYNYVL
jgi:hypothetical protein